MTTYPSFWDVDADGSWSDAANWWTYVPNPNPPVGYPYWFHVLPGADDDVSLAPTNEPAGTSAGTSPFTVTFNTTATINSLTGPTYATLKVTGGSLTLNATMNFQGALNISHGLVLIKNAGGATSLLGGLGVNNAYLPALNMTGGQLKINAGALILTGVNTLDGGTVSGAGKFIVGGFSTLDIGAGAAITAATFELGVALNGNTSLTNLDADFAYAGKFLLDDWSGNNAVLNLNGHKLTLSGTSTLDGTINGPGDLVFASGSVAGFSAGGADFYALGGVDILNQGVVNQTYEFHLGGTLDNAAGATYNLLTDGGITNQGGVTFTNEGTLAKTGGAGVSAIYADFSTSGDVNVQTGAIAVNGGGGTLDGTIEGAGAFDIRGGGAYTLASTLALTTGTFGLDDFGGGSASLTLGSNRSYGGTFNVGSQFANTLIDLSGHALTLSGATTFTAPFGGVTIKGGSLTFAAGSTAALDDTYIAGGVTITNSGALTDNGYVYLDSDGGAATTKLTNTASGVISIGDVSNAINAGGSAALIVNAGKIVKTAGTGDSDIRVALNNTGTLEADSGALRLFNGATLGGTMSGAGKITLRGAAAYTLKSSLSLTVANLDVLDSASVTLGKSFAYAGVLYEGGQFSATTLDLAGFTLTIKNAATFTAPFGSLTVNPGKLIIASGASATFDDINFKGGVTLQNSGTLGDNGFVVLDSDGGAAQTLVQNMAAGTINLQADGNVFTAGGSAASIANAGKIAKTAGTADSDIRVALANTGTLEADVGEIRLYNGATLGGTLSGAGKITLRGAAAYALNPTTLTVAALAITDSASVTLGRSLTYSGAFYEGGGFTGTTLDLAGFTLTLKGSATFTAPFGSVNIKGGTVVLAAGSTASLDDVNLAAGATIKNSGTLTDNLYLTLDSDGGAAASLFQNLATGVVNIAGDGPAFRSGGASASIVNAGKIDKTAGAGIATIAPAVINNKTLQSDSGALELLGAVSGTGTDVIGAGAGLIFDSSVSAGQTVKFTGAGGVLTLNDYGEFLGAITGFAKTGANEEIDVGGPWVWTGFVENAGHTQGVMTFTNTNTNATFGITLNGNYDPTHFSHAVVNGVTHVTYA